MADTRTDDPRQEREPEGGPLTREKSFFDLRLGAGDDRTELPPGYRRKLIREYRRRAQTAATEKGAPAGVRLSAIPSGARRRIRFASPAAPAGLNWSSIGPSVVLNGQLATHAPVSGRVTALAVSADGRRIYAAAGNGGLWRSDDAGRTWYSLMNGFALHAPYNHSDSLSMGAVAIHPAQPDRIYAGTGEGQESDAYYGVGPILSDDGGLNWRTEKWDAAPGAGSWFFEMAVDPTDPEHLLAATARGIFRRQPRNHAVAALDPLPERPQSYFLQYDSSSGAPAVNYWTGEGTDTEAAWNLGGASWRWGLDFMPFSLDSEPWFLSYMPRGGRWPWSVAGGSFRVYRIDGAGVPQKQLAAGASGDWDDGLTLMPFTHGGEAYFVRYNSGTGAATLARWNTLPSNGTFEEIWAQEDWPGTAGGVAAATRWGQIMPFQLDGAPFFLAYLSLGRFANSDLAMLYRWTGTLEVEPVWDGPRSLGSKRYSLIPFEVEGKAWFQAYNSGTGAARIFRWHGSGDFSEEASATYDTGLDLVPFSFADKNDGAYTKDSRFLAYNKSDGRASVFHFPAGPEPSLLWSRTWGSNLRFVPFEIGYEWLDQQANGLPAPPNSKATSVVVARGGLTAAGVDTTTFYTAFSGGSAYSWQPAVGGNWVRVGPANGAPGGLPNAPGNISLAVQPSNPDTIYALIQNSEVYRYSTTGPGANNWQQITGTPPTMDMARGQGNYDLAIAVAPDNINRIYLGGATIQSPINGGAAREWGAALYRCEIAVAVGGAVSAVPTLIGSSVHADIHALVFSPTGPGTLWVACDGGVFSSSSSTTPGAPIVPGYWSVQPPPQPPPPLPPPPAPFGLIGAQANDLFTSRNTGLSTMTVNKMAQNRSQDAVIFTGTQDNGTERFRGSPVWRREVIYGDGGAMVIRHGNDQQIIAGMNLRTYFLSANGGTTFPNAAAIPLIVGDNVLFYPPIVGASAADRIGFGTRRPWLSDDFATNWSSIPGNVAGDILGSTISSMAFTGNGLTLYVGLLNGQIWKFVDAGAVGASNWGAGARLDNVGAPNSLADFLAAPRPITSITVDPTGDNSIYVTLGGNLTVAPFVGTGWKRIWHFANPGGVVANGLWSQASGPEPQPQGVSQRLMNVQFSALAARAVGALPGATNHLYAAGDIGLWESQDAGATWVPFAEGLPESSVVDVGFFEPRPIVLADGTAVQSPRLLRAATHGRGIYERILPPDDEPVNPDVVARYQRYEQPVQLYLRATTLDRGLYDVQTGAGALDPANGNTPVHYWDGDGIKTSNPTNVVFPVPAGTPYTFPRGADISFEQFAELTDDSNGLFTVRRTRIYVELNNRGVAAADDVRLTLLLSRRLGPLPFAAPPPPAPGLPPGLAAAVSGGTFIDTRDWKTLAVTAHDDVQVGFPEIAVADIPDDRIRTAGIYCLLAIAHAPDDPFTDLETEVETLVLGDSKVIMKYLSFT